MSSDLYRAFADGDDLQEVVKLTEALWQAQDLDVLVSVYGQYECRDENVTWFSNEEIQEGLILRLPVQLWIDIYRHAKTIEERRRLTCLIWDVDEVRKLILVAWEAKDLEEVAIHYGALYMEGSINDLLSNSRQMGKKHGCLDGYPKAMLKALRGHTWEKVYPGILIWLDEELAG